MTQRRLFDGYEIKADYVVLEGMGKLALDVVKPDLDVHIGDEFEVTMRFKLGSPEFPAKFTGTGLMKGKFAQMFRAYPLDEGFAVTAYVTNEDREAQWQEAHGVGTA